MKKIPRIKCKNLVIFAHIVKSPEEIKPSQWVAFLS